MVKDFKIIVFWDVTMQFGRPVKKIKGKAIPTTGCGGPKGSEMLRLTHFIDNRLTDGSKVVSLTHWPPFTPGRFLVLISVRG
jgi:hypothetical protein